MKLKLLFFFLFSFYLGACAQVAFEHNIVIDSTFSVRDPLTIASADIDNDGFKDLLVGGDYNAVWVRSTDGIGSFERVRRPIVNQHLDASVIAAADFDGDNDLDVVILSRNNSLSFSDLLYVENTDGLGTFSEPIVLATTESANGLHLQLADVDNDGDIDIAYSSSANFSWVENTDGQASFTNHYLLGINGGFCATDIDGNDSLDFVVDVGNYLNAYKLNAEGTLSLLESMDTFSLNEDIKAGDIDGDGDNDVVTFFKNGATQQILWFENTDGPGTFAYRQILFNLAPNPGGSGGNTRGLEIIDMDNDSLLDIVTYQSARGGMSWYKNMGGGVFGDEQVITNQIASLRGTTISDLDNDDAPDILFTNFSINEFSWIKNQDGLGNFSNIRRVSSYVYYVNHVDYGDIDGDGDLDLVSSSHGDHKVAWYENTNGLGDFSTIQQLISDSTTKAKDAFAVDMDGDGDIDVLVASFLDFTTDEHQLIWFENDGTGTFTEHIFATTTTTINRINYADLDNDGDMDVISGRENSVFVVYKNNGDGTFAPPEIFSQPGFSYILSLQVADMDDDGDIDVLASSNAGAIIWLENDGLGDLSTSHVITDYMHYPTSIFAADIDGDSDMDVLFVNQYVGEVGYFLNEDGQGTFGPEVVTSDIPEDPESIYSIDVDNDGDMDMITNSSEGQKFIWFPNDGNAGFGDPVEITSFIGRVNHITSADINADGKVDLITSSYDDDKVAWFKNLGVTFNNTISGVARLDANADGCDATDAGIPNLLIQTQNNNNTFATFTQSDGSFTLQANQENFTTSILSPLPTYYTSNPTSHTFDFTGLFNADSQSDFCIEANQIVNNLNIVIYPNLNDPRPGFETSYRLIYKNIGTTPLSGTIDFQFDDAKLILISASETVATQTANTLTFNYSNLLPFESRYIDLVFDVSPPPTASIGDLLISTATINPLTEDTNADDNSFNLEQIVTSGYDPNDIRVLEGEEITLDEADLFLHYIIRFQNTGTASAINIRVNNILDEQLDWSTLQLENLSHPGSVEITDGNNVNFIFDSINLPDSTSDELNSHGFIAYKIKPMSDVVVGDVFSNTANIYFDFNPPIETNTATTEIVNPLSVSTIETNTVKLHPNPASSILTIKSKNTIHLIRIYDVNGRLLRTLSRNNETVSLDVSDLAEGLYFMEINSKNNIQTLKFIKM